MKLTERILKHKMLSGVAIAVFAFALGVFAYGIFLFLQYSEPAEAATTSVSARVERCDCIVKFFPAQALPGAGTESDPYQTEGSAIDLVIGVNGAGQITVTDENGVVLFSYYKSSGGYEEIRARVSLPEGAHRLTALLDGNEIMWDGSAAVLYFMVENGSWIDVPGTGYFRVFGQQIDVAGAVGSGLMGSVLFVGLFILFIVLKNREADDRKAKSQKEKRRANAQINPRMMKKSGIIKK